jgi:hypothetical protein
MKMQIELSQSDLSILLHALAACTKSGGGSPENTLLGRLCNKIGLAINPNLALAYQQTAADELSD